MHARHALILHFINHLPNTLLKIELVSGEKFQNTKILYFILLYSYRFISYVKKAYFYAFCKNDVIRNFIMDFLVDLSHTCKFENELFFLLETCKRMISVCNSVKDSIEKMEKQFSLNNFQMYKVKEFLESNLKSVTNLAKLLLLDNQLDIKFDQ